MEDLSTVDALSQLTFLVHGTLVEVAAAHDLSITQLRMLGILRDREPGMQELAKHLGLDKSSVTGLVDRAERRELVRRTISHHDRRAVTVSLTPTGRTLAAAVTTTATTSITALVGSLTAQQERDLVRLTSKILPAFPDPS